MSEEDLNPEKLRAITTEMVEAITSPAYVEAMRSMRATSEDKRLGEAMRRLTPEALRDQGVRLPEGMRISSRYFEPAFKPVEVGSPATEPNTLSELYRSDPGLVDRLGALRTVNPQLYERMTEQLTGGNISPLALCACACGGAATACGGVGAG